MHYPYLKGKTFFSPKEHQFYLELKKLADERGLIVFAKVRLADLVWIPRSYKKWHYYFIKIMAKQIDFVLCDKESLTIKCLIELDDETHDLPSRKSRDYFVNNAIEHAKHNFLRCRPDQHHCVVEVVG